MKKRCLPGVNEHFESDFNAELRRVRVFQRSIRRTFVLCLFSFFLAGCGSFPARHALVTDPSHRYFMEIALGSEFGNNQHKIKKWDQDLHIQIVGQPTREDMETLKAVIKELAGLTKLEFFLTEKEYSNVKIYFVNKSRFSEIERNYVPGNEGFFWVWWYPLTKEIFQARILISATGITQRERNHLIREELTQILGLMNDSCRYANSIFYQRWSRVNQYSEMDKRIIRMLYHPSIRAGMSENEVVRILEAMEFGAGLD